MTRTVPLSYTINVSVSTTPSGLGEYNSNSICLLTNETPLSTQPYIWAVNTQDAINEYGTDSLTAKMAQALFTPVPNLRTGNGQVLIFPYTATNATAGTTTTVAITNTIITALKAISTGDLTVTIDGTDYTCTNLNFTNISTVDDVVAILKAQYLDCDIALVNTNKIKFTSRNYGTTAAVALKATTGGTGTDLYGSSYLDGANQTTVAGTAQTGTTVAEALAQAEEAGYFGGVLTTQIIDNTLIEATANQVNQFGGYTGMLPVDFKNLVMEMAKEIGVDESLIILAGDHLGPLTWAGEPEAEAMAKAEELVRQFVLAGFTKIHLDTSMKLGDDSKEEMLETEVIARRGVRLYKVCMEAYAELLKEKPEVNMFDVLRELSVSALTPNDDIYSIPKVKKEKVVKEASKPKVVEEENLLPEMPVFDADLLKLYKKIPMNGECAVESLADETTDLRTVMKLLLKLEMGRFVIMLPGERVKRNIR